MWTYLSHIVFYFFNESLNANVARKSGKVLLIRRKKSRGTDLIEVPNLMYPLPTCVRIEVVE